MCVHSGVWRYLTKCGRQPASFIANRLIGCRGIILLKFMDEFAFQSLMTVLIAWAIILCIFMTIGALAKKRGRSFGLWTMIPFLIPFVLNLLTLPNRWCKCLSPSSTLSYSISSRIDINPFKRQN